MENDIEKQQEAIKELAETFIEAFKPVIEAIKRISDSITTTFTNVWNETKPILSSLDFRISRKRFIKLLMSSGYQRNEANKIAREYHSKNGKYTFLDYLVEAKKKEV